jgi:hypothetical protein
VRKHHRRQVLGVLAGRKRQIGRDLRPVGRRDRHRLDPGESSPFELGPLEHRLVERLPVAVEQIEAPRVGIAPSVDQELAAVGGRIDEFDDRQVWKSLRQ